MYRRIAFAVADLSLAVGGTLLVWGVVRLHDDVQRLYGVFLGFAAILVGGVQLGGHTGFVAGFRRPGLSQLQIERAVAQLGRP